MASLGRSSPGTGYLKSDPHAPADFFAAEAAGLAWLREAHVDAGGAPVVEVLEVGQGRIVLERLPHARPSQAAARAFGRRLARTHASSAPHFGCPPDGWDGGGYIGPLRLPLLPPPPQPVTDASARWGPFFARHRVIPYLDAAVERGRLHAQDERAVREVVDHLLACDVAVCGPDEPPQRIHGDLWSGNVVWTPRGAVLIDPAAHGGHRESDLAMLALFGAPYLTDILAGYEEAAPLAEGWQQRVPVHQLHPLLVHVVLFGGGYGEQAGRAAREALAAQP